MRALVTGATGQDGIILSNLLARQGVQTFGLVKPGSSIQELNSYAPQIKTIEVDLEDSDSLFAIVRDIDPSHVWNLGGFTSPGASWDRAHEVARVNVDAVSAMIAAIAERGSIARFFQAASSTVFEGTDRSPQNEQTAFSPKSPYAESKAKSIEIIANARLNGIFACSGIFYNHESPLRGENFVTRKVTKSVARISAGLEDFLELGDIEVARDWGWAPDYVRAAMLMLDAAKPKDYVLATGISHRLSYFVAKAFAAAGIPNWRDYVVLSSDNSRPVDTNLMVGDSRAAYQDLGWRHTIDFDSMARKMVEHDLSLIKDPDSLWQI